DCPRPRRCGAIGSYCRLEVRRPPAALSPGRDLRPRPGEPGDLALARLDRTHGGGSEAAGRRPRRRILAGDSLHVDDTPVPVLAPGTGKTKTGRLWTYVRDERLFGGSRKPAALFVYSPDRKGEHPRAHLKDFRGVIHADGYAGFNELFVDGRIVEAACWAHVRRKFFDVHAATGSPIAKEALDRIGQLYAVENIINGLPPERRRQRRHLQ